MTSITDTSPSIIQESPANSPRGSRYLPNPPSDDERHTYFSCPAKWEFTWLFIAQLLIIYSYVNVMKKNPYLWPGLILLTFMVPPTFVNFWLRIHTHRISLAEHLKKVSQWHSHDDNAELPSIDIFLPVCGEDDEVVDNTCFHLSQLDYGRHLNVYVLDDAVLSNSYHR